MRMTASFTSARRAHSAFEEVYRENFAFVWRALRCLGVPERALDDAAQDVFVVVHRRLPSFEGRSSIKSWLYEISRRVASRYRVKERRDAPRTLEVPELPADAGLDAALDRATASSILASFVSGLDEPRSKVFILAEFGRMGGREIAETLGVNMNTVYARLRSARTELDRVAHRVGAREARALTGSLRREPAIPASQRRTWVALVGKLGLAPVGAGAMSVLHWGVVGGFIGGGVLAVMAVTARPPSHPAPAREPIHEISAPSASRTAPRASTRPETVVADVTPVPPEGSAGGRPAPRPTRAAKPATRPVPAPDRADLSAEVEWVRRLRAAVEAKDTGVAELVAGYRTRFATGRLRAEVDALEVQLACSDGRGDEALARFARRWPDSSLLPRLHRLCAPTREKTTGAGEIGPQKPEPPGTPPS